MAGEVDRVLLCIRRVEDLASQLERASSTEIGLVRAYYDRAKRLEQAAMTALVAAAHQGDPEALVAIDALAEEIEERTWICPRSAA